MYLNVAFQKQRAAARRISDASLRRDEKEVVPRKSSCLIHERGESNRISKNNFPCGGKNKRRHENFHPIVYQREAGGKCVLVGSEKIIRHMDEQFSKTMMVMSYVPKYSERANECACC